jgi:hypothetical protein
LGAIVDRRRNLARASRNPCRHKERQRGRETKTRMKSLQK